jgi:5-formyltetrahydrofolate cyclo-ligase
LSFHSSWQGSGVINGFGFSELLVVGALVLIFFGSKELPRFVRETGRMLGRLRRYSDRVRRELNEVTRSMDTTWDASKDLAERKKTARGTYLSARTALTDEQRREKSQAIRGHLQEYPDFVKAQAVMIYVSVGSEVDTGECIAEILAMKKRVVVPYTNPYGFTVGIAEITDPETQLEKGTYGIREPLKALKDNFFKSDLQLIVCPGVAFDTRGARLGRGKGCYDGFLKEVRGKIPIIGLAFECQISNELLPLDYHDVVMDQVITEEGKLIGRGQEPLSEREPGDDGGMIDT